MAICVQQRDCRFATSDNATSDSATGGSSMRMIKLLTAAMLTGMAAASAQDIAGVEDCTKTAGLDRRTGCLQANVNFLQRTMTRNASDAQRRLQAAEAEIVALKTSLAALRKQ